MSVGTAVRATGADAVTTRAQQLTSVGVVEPAELRLGPLRADELLVEVRATGICGSDRAAFLGTHPYKQAPCVLGHEMSGVVIAVGSDVRRLAVGDAVASAAFSNCGCCEVCLSGSVHLCPDKESLSHDGWPGTFAEHVVLRERMAVRLPDGVPDDVAALVEPLAIGAHAAGLVSDRPRRTVVVLGSGTIGLATAVAVRVRGAERVVCVDRGALKGELALSVGAAAYVDVLATPDVTDAVLARTGGLADVTFVTAGYVGVVEDAVALTRPGGAVVLVSYFEEPHLLDLNPLVTRGISVLGSALCGPADLARATTLLLDADVDVARLVTHRFPLHRAQEALDLMVSDPESVGKIVMFPGGHNG